MDLGIPNLHLIVLAALLIVSAVAIRLMVAPLAALCRLRYRGVIDAAGAAAILRRRECVGRILTLAFLMALLLGREAHAQAAAAGTLDLTWLHQTLADAAYAVVMAAIAIGGTWLRAHLNFVQNDALKRAAGDLVDDVGNAAKQAAGFAYGWAQKSNLSIDHPQIRDAALSQGIAMALTVAPSLLQRAGYSQATFEQMAEAEFGHLLALDPTVSVAGPALRPYEPELVPGRLIGTPAEAAAGAQPDNSSAPDPRATSAQPAA